MGTAPFIIVAIDGGAASGKSSTSRLLAERFNLLHVDTGSFYRHLTAELLRLGVASSDASGIQAALAGIRLTTRVDGDTVRIAIRDDGPGIPADVKARIFDPFFTTKDVGAGTGLGLSISHGIIAAHGGRIDVESAPGQGATFTIVLPIAARALDRAVARESR